MNTTIINKEKLKSCGQKIVNQSNDTKYMLSKNALQDVASVVLETRKQAENNPNQFAKLKDNTIKSLVNYGVEDLPMLSRRGHVRENILTEEQAKKLGYSVKNKHFHGLGVKTYLEIINSLDNPIAVYHYTNKGKYNENNFIVLTPIEIDGKKAIVPIEINNNPGQYNNVEIDYNNIKTVYFKDNNNYNDNLLNEDKIKEIFTGSNSQQTSLSTNNIPLTETNVNDISTNSNIQ